MTLRGFANVVQYYILELKRIVNLLAGYLDASTTEISYG